MAKDTNIIKSRAEYTRAYTNMRGGDCSDYDKGDATERYGYTANMYVDYESEADALESIPGYRRVLSLDGKINGMFAHRGESGDYLLIHSGDKLYRYNKDSRDTATAPTLIGTLKDKRSTAFNYGDGVFVMDGEKILLVDGEGTAKSLDLGEGVYVPTLFVDGKRQEERNLLTNAFAEEISLVETVRHSYGTKGLVYQIISEEEATCRVSGAREPIAGALYIPAYARLGGKEYRVVEIGDWAFAQMSSLTSLTTSEGLERISRYAFMNCTALESVILSPSVTEVGAYTFFGCEALTYFHFGVNLKVFGTASLTKCTALKELSFAGDIDLIATIDGKTNLTDRTVNCNKKISSARIALPLTSVADSVEKLYFDGVEYTDYSFSADEGAVIIDLDERLELEGKRARIVGRLSPCSPGDTEGFLSEHPEISENTLSAILGCTIGEVFDGRIFLSGNPRFPGTVFYSSVTTASSLPTYFGERCFFNDGRGAKITALLPISGSLAVFKERDEGFGSIFCHKPEVSGERIEYPVSFTHGGISGTEAAYTFLDDHLFLCSEGILALGGGSDYRKIYNRSATVSRLIRDKSSPMLTEWKGYLVLLVGEDIFLADSRDKTGTGSDFGYEWYLLSGIGGYRNASRVYRYSSAARDGYFVADTPDEKVTETVMSVKEADGTFTLYAERGGRKYQVYLTEELEGGSFYPATAIASVGELLFFGTESGDVFVFNSDKRGVPPSYLSEMTDFDSVDYGRRYGKRIHPSFYDFDGHAPLCAVRTKSDDCSLPYLTKRTVPHSLTLKLKCMQSGELTSEVGTAESGYSEIATLPTSLLDFSELDFSRLTFSTEAHSTVELPERREGWCEKQISVYSQAWRSPIGVYSIAYRYKIKGAIKNQ